MTASSLIKLCVTLIDATPSSTAPPPPLEEFGGDGSEALDLSSATALIQQQQNQIQTLLQRQQQMQSQTSSLLAPALQVRSNSVCRQHASPHMKLVIDVIWRFTYYVLPCTPAQI